MLPIGEMVQECRRHVDHRVVRFCTRPRSTAYRTWGLNGNWLATIGTTAFHPYRQLILAVQLPKLLKRSITTAIEIVGQILKINALLALL